jgi:hypothetical protein
MIVWGGRDSGQTPAPSEAQAHLAGSSTATPAAALRHKRILPLILSAGRHQQSATLSSSSVVRPSSGEALPSSSSVVRPSSGEALSTVLADGARLVQNAVPLHPGWNLLSLPFGSDGSLASLPFTAGTAAWTYDAASGRWLRYRPDLPAYANTFNSITPAQGVWVNLSQESLLPQDAPIPASTAITLQPGWNLVGLPRTTPTTVGAAFGALYPNPVDRVVYDAENTWVEGDANTPLYPGLGLWVHLSRSTPVTWTVTNP